MVYTSRIALVAVFILASCSSLPREIEKPKARLSKVELASLSFQGMDLDFEVSLENPYPLGLRVASVKATFLVEGNQIFATETQEELRVEANATAMLPFRINLKFADLAQAARDYTQKAVLDTEIQLVVTVDIHSGSLPGVPETWDFPFTLHKKLPTIKPSVGISEFRIERPTAAQVAAQLKAKARELASRTIKNISPDRVVSALDALLRGQPRKAVQQAIPELDIRDLDLRFALEFTLNLNNETPTALLFENLAFNFQMNNEPLIDGTTSQIQREGNRSMVTIRGVFSSRALSDGLLQAFQDRRASFSFRGQTQVKLPDVIRVEPVTLDFTQSGEFAL